MKHFNQYDRRDDGLRRLARLTWRATLVSLLMAIGMMVLFAKTAVHYVTTASAGPTTPAPASSGGTQPTSQPAPTLAPPTQPPAPAPSPTPAPTKSSAS